MMKDILYKKSIILALAPEPWRSYLAYLHQICPNELCWKIEGASMKGKGAPAAPPHRDEYDTGRLQCVVALSPGAFDVWPGSHKLRMAHTDCPDGHFHFGEKFQQELNFQFKRVVFSCQPGDVLIFQGGTFVHGSPPVEEHNPSPRIVTYAQFWPPGTPKGAEHIAKKCKCFS